MNCPTCGAPNVILHKDIWECGWCGDSGFIPQRIQDARRAAKTARIPKEITLTLTVEPSENEDAPKQPFFFDSAVERIVEQFPELKDEYESEALSGMMGAQLLEEVYRTDSQKAIAMWRSLPEKQEPLRDSDRAENFFYLLDFLWENEDYNKDAIAPLLDAVRKDDTLAEMMFRSHYVCRLHLYLIQAAFEQSKTELAEHLYALLQSNSLPREKWSEAPDEFDALMEEYANADDSSPKNAARRMRPDEFDRWLKGFFKSFDFSKQPELKSLTKNPERVLRATFRSTLDSCGCDEEEIHYLCGNAPESVFARNYCAFDDPRELAKLAAMLDKYAISLTETPYDVSEFKISRKDEDAVMTSTPNCRFSGDVIIDIDGISEHNFEAGSDLLLCIKSNDNMFFTAKLKSKET